MSKSLKKGLSILKLFSEAKPYWTLDEIVEALAIPKTTVFRLIKPFEEEGLLQKVTLHHGSYSVQANMYQLGTVFLELGHVVKSQYEIRNIALPLMRELKERLKESVQLVVNDNDEAIYIEKVESDNMIQLYTKVGRRAPLFLGACPRILLSFSNDEDIERVIAKNETLIKKHDKNKDIIWNSIYETRKSGYTYSDSELEPGTAALGTPIFDEEGKIAASLSIASVSTVLTEESINEFVKPMWEVSKEISRKIGFNKNYPYY